MLHSSRFLSPIAYTKFVRFNLHRHIARPLIAVALMFLLLAGSIPRALTAPSVREGAPRTASDPKPKSESKRIASSSTPSQQTKTERRSGELLVRFRAGASEHDKDNAILSQGARRKKQLHGESGIEKLDLSAGRDPETAALQLLLNPAVEFAEPNFLIHHDTTRPNDSRFAEEWALDNTGQTGGTFGADIGATSAWDMTTGSFNTVIAIIDSGVDFSHPDLVATEWTNRAVGAGTDLHGWDYVTDSGVIKDEQGHGTAIAGIIAAQGNNAAGISGVMWRASLMSLRVLDNTGTGDVGDAVEAIDYAVAHGAQVINLSWGTTGASVTLKDAIERAIRHDVVVVCSAGNGGQDDDTIPYFPASFDSKNLIAAASTDSRDQLTSWSNWGRKSISVAAPGTDILTTKMGGGYWTVSGTSASAPLTTGVVGLLKTSRPWLRPHEVAQAVTNGARAVPSLSNKVSSGGVLSASGALASLHGPATPPPGWNGNNGNGNIPPGLQTQRPPSPGHGSGGRGSDGGFSTTPPSKTSGAPGSNMPDLDQVRNTKPSKPKASAPIQSNLVCADCDPQSGGGGGGYYPSGDPNFSTARMRPANQTGQRGVNLGSRNFNWSASLLNLTGRAGLDLDLALFYNSLVWTRDGSYIKYNADLGSPAPGFQIGLPKLQRRFTDSQTGIYSYVMVTSSGGRVEMRQIGTSNIYESADGSYTQLDASNPSVPVVRTTDGTQLTFTPVTINSEFRCTQMTDRNGNYISATYDSTNGHLQTITDTLGRIITFVYDGSNNLQAIRQTWAGVAHDWATFYYGEVYVAPSFGGGGGLLVNGPNNNYVTVLTQVSLHDGTYYTFGYNAAFGQVNQVNHYAADAHLLAYTSYNMNPNSGQTDCPRFTEQHDWAENWNNSAEAITYFSVAGDNSWSQETVPDGTIYKEFFATTGWQTGLPTSTEVWSGGVEEKWTTTSWTQDDINLTFLKNPRVTETNVYDAEGNHKRTTISYGPYAAYSLPYEVIEYAADGVTMLRGTYTDYNLDPNYVNRRIIGLVMWVHVVDHVTNSYVAKTTYDYDWSGEYLTTTPQTATNHSANNADPTGRGNLVRVLRWDVTDINNGAKTLQQTMGYDSAGCRVFQRDGLGHQTSISYADSFSDGVNRNTFAYPTTVTDPDGFSSTSQYNFDFGAVTRTQDPKGAVQTMTYETAGRIERITNQVNGAYARNVYHPYGDIAAFATIQDGAGEAFSVTYFDGAGRLRSTGSDLPGSSGGYRGQFTLYDVMGRVSQQTNPAEMNNLWAPSGDDAAGWVWTYQTYDWNGRTRVTTLPDGSTREITYGGCGCAGGDVTTARDERGRRRTATMDSLGRLKQLDELNWDQSVYATTTYAYNVRDQLTSINQAGLTRTLGYDPYGRLSSRTTPEQGTTNYSYFADDTTQTVTDARGATATFGYNNRHLVTGITYGVPGGVAATASVSFGYDSAGNRTSMTDGLGSVSYAYNTLSQMTSETRTLTGVGSFTLTYGSYNLSGELTSMTNPWGAQAGYNYDKVGRPTAVSGSGYAGVSSYINSIGYRAFGIKQMGYANGRTLSLSYDNRLRLTGWDIPGVMGWNYAYNYFNENSGRVTYAQNLYDSSLDRSYDYDHVGRLISAHTGIEARAHIGIGPWNGMDGPYSQDRGYDQFGNATHRVGWGGYQWGGFDQWYSFANNQLIQDPGTGAYLQYDAAGNLTNDGNQSFTYDATGQQTYASGSGLTQSYDGDRLRVAKTENGVTTYYLRSSVLGGQVVGEINSGGSWTRGFVYLGGQMVAIQSSGVYWTFQDPVTKSQRVTDGAGNVVSTIDLDPWGGETWRSSNQAFQPHRYTTYERDNNGGDEAMMRRYQSYWNRFSQPDPFGGSYNLTDPQSFNRYAYVQNDPATFVDPTGLLPMMCGLFYLGDGYYGYVCFGDFEPFRGFNPKPGGGHPTPPVPARPSDECRAAALNNLANELNARKELYLSDTKQAVSLVAGGVSGARTGGMLLSPGAGLLGLGGAAIGGMIGIAVAGMGNDAYDANIESGPVNRFKQAATKCDKMARQEKAAAAKSGPFMEAGLPQQFVVTRKFGTFSLYSYTLKRGPTSLGDYLFEEHGPNPTDHIKTWFGR